MLHCLLWIWRKRTQVKKCQWPFALLNFSPKDLLQTSVIQRCKVVYVLFYFTLFAMLGLRKFHTKVLVEPQVTLASLTPGLAIKKFFEILLKVDHLKLIPERFFLTPDGGNNMIRGGEMASLYLSRFVGLGSS